jgi:hypothetical protein
VKKFLIGYFNYLQVLILALFLYLLVWLLMHHVEPAALADWLWPDSFLVWQILFAAANFFTGTFIFQNRRLGAWLAGTLASIMFFKFSHFVFTLPLIIALITSSVLLFLWLWGGQLWRRQRRTALI